MIIVNTCVYTLRKYSDRYSDIFILYGRLGSSFDIDDYELPKDFCYDFLILLLFVWSLLFLDNVDI